MVFNPITRSTDPLIKNVATHLVNNTGAAVTKGQIAAYQPSTESAVACTSARINWIQLVALEDIASGATGRWAYCGQVEARVGSASADAIVMPSPVVSGGATLVAFTATTYATNAAVGQLIETSSGTTNTTYVMFDGLSGRPFGYRAVAS